MTNLFEPPIRRVNHGRGHRYVDANGAPVPGVTTILDHGVPKPALINWAAATTAGYAVDHWDELSELSISKRLKELEKARFGEKKAAAARGTHIHKVAEDLIDGREVELPDEIAGHVEGYAAFLDRFGVRPVLVEAVCVSYRYGYAGTFDLLADFPSLGLRLLCDLKTSARVYGETAWQLAAYRHADRYRLGTGEEKPMPVVDGCAVIHVRADGTDLFPIEAGPDQLREFRYLQQVAAAIDRSPDYVGEAISPPELEEDTA